MGKPAMSQLIALVMIASGVVRAADAPGQTSPGSFVFSYFTGNGEDGLHLAYSRDGLTWRPLKGGRSFLTPAAGSKLMRDPCICRGPEGTFHMVWTTGWGDRGIGLAHSTDLIHWSDQTWLEVMAHEPNAVNCWAPEIFYDARTSKYLIYWSTTIPGRFPETEETGSVNRQGQRLNHRIYYTTTSDFKTYADVKLFYDDGFNVIDATLVTSDSRYVMFVKDETLVTSDGRYVMFVKDETQRPVAKKNIRIAVAERAEGPYGPASKPFSPDWVEGPTVLKIGSLWYVYYDAYTRHRMEGARSRDLKTWEPITEQLSFPKGVRHGTALAVPGEVLAELMKAE
jgi:beta-xylosidase